ncbi:hypothetical protein HDF16_000211 [Granulicella aggregans]|uniref:Uncharacterized protein n=1 Tax=Granulicella aggregans TaxID=474949 RepID=A0A7W7Z9C4_9BACT|nr:hypothetical protein [Granulicella aggregans]
MDVSLILAEIDSQIAKLQQARDIISGTTSTPVPVKTGAKRGRPKGSKNASTKIASTKIIAKAPLKATAKATKRKLSPEGRKAIADAMKKRWAERKKLAAK